VLVVRAMPCRATPDGQILLRLARQMAELQADVLTELTPAGGQRRRLPVVVNADSLATWFLPVLSDAAGWDDCALELLIEIEDHGTEHLRTGQAVGAVTSDPVVVPGCTIEPLGTLRYLPVCTPALADAYRTSNGVDWQRMPMMRFSAADDLQHRLLERHGVREVEVEHVIPSNQGYLAGVLTGLGWGVVSEPQLGDSLQTGALVRLGARDHVDVHLAWQSWRLGSTATVRLTESVHRAARRGLRPARRA